MLLIIIVVYLDQNDNALDDNERFTKNSINQRQQRYRSPHNPYSHYLGHSKLKLIIPYFASDAA